MATPSVRPVITDPAPWAASRVRNLAAMSKSGLADSYSTSAAGAGSRTFNYYNQTPTSAAAAYHRIGTRRTLQPNTEISTVADTFAAPSPDVSTPAPDVVLPSNALIADPDAHSPLGPDGYRDESRAVPGTVPNPDQAQRPSQSNPTVPSQGQPGLAVPAQPSQGQPGLAVPAQPSQGQPGLAVPAQPSQGQPGLAVPAQGQPGLAVPAEEKPEQGKGQPGLAVPYDPAYYDGPSVFDIGNAPEGQAEGVPWTTTTQMGWARSTVLPGYGGQTVDTEILGPDNEVLYTLRRVSNGAGGYTIWMNAGGVMSVIYSPGTMGMAPGHSLQLTVAPGDDPAYPSIVSDVTEGGTNVVSLDTRTGNQWGATNLDNSEQEITFLDPNNVQQSYRTNTDEMGNDYTEHVGERRPDRTGWYLGTDGLLRTYNADRSTDVSGTDSLGTYHNLHVTPDNRASGTTFNDLRNEKITLTPYATGTLEVTSNTAGQMRHIRKLDMYGNPLREWKIGSDGKWAEFERHTDGTFTIFQQDGTRIHVKDMWRSTVYFPDGSQEDVDNSPKVDTRSSKEKLFDSIGNALGGGWENVVEFGSGIIVLTGQGKNFNDVAGWFGYEPNLPSWTEAVFGKDLPYTPDPLTGLAVGIGIGLGKLGWEVIGASSQGYANLGDATLDWLTGNQSFSGVLNQSWQDIQKVTNVLSKGLLLTDLEGSTEHPAKTAGELTVGVLTFWLPTKGLKIPGRGPKGGTGAGVDTAVAAAQRTAAVEAVTSAIRVADAQRGAGITGRALQTAKDAAGQAGRITSAVLARAGERLGFTKPVVTDGSSAPAAAGAADTVKTAPSARPSNSSPAATTPATESGRSTSGFAATVRTSVEAELKWWTDDPGSPLNWPGSVWRDAMANMRALLPEWVTPEGFRSAEPGSIGEFLGNIFGIRNERGGGSSGGGPRAPRYLGDETAVADGLWRDTVKYTLRDRVRAFREAALRSVTGLRDNKHPTSGPIAHRAEDGSLIEIDAKPHERAISAATYKNDGTGREIGSANISGKRHVFSPGDQYTALPREHRIFEPVNAKAYSREADLHWNVKEKNPNRGLGGQDRINDSEVKLLEDTARAILADISGLSRSEIDSIVNDAAKLVKHPKPHPNRPEPYDARFARAKERIDLAILEINHVLAVRARQHGITAREISLSDAKGVLHMVVDLPSMRLTDGPARFVVCKSCGQVMAMFSEIFDVRLKVEDLRGEPLYPVEGR